MTLYAWLVGTWAATLWFFTFGVARMLFVVFPRERAGEITTALFPAYFMTVIALGLLSTIVLRFRCRDRRGRIALILQAVALAGLAAIPLFVQPALILHEPGSSEFARWHGLSMALNLAALILVPLAALVALARRNPGASGCGAAQL